MWVYSLPTSRLFLFGLPDSSGTRYPVRSVCRSTHSGMQQQPYRSRRFMDPTETTAHAIQTNKAEMQDLEVVRGCGLIWHLRSRRLHHGQDPLNNALNRATTTTCCQMPNRRELEPRLYKCVCIASRHPIHSRATFHSFRFRFHRNLSIIETITHSFVFYTRLFPSLYLRAFYQMPGFL